MGTEWKPSSEDEDVFEGFDRASENNILLTYRTGGARRTFVAGGLTYFDFLKRASVKRPDKEEKVLERAEQELQASLRLLLPQAATHGWDLFTNSRFDPFRISPHHDQRATAISKRVC